MLRVCRNLLLLLNEVRSSQHDVEFFHRLAQVFEADVICSHTCVLLILVGKSGDGFELANDFQHLDLHHGTCNFVDALVTALHAYRAPDVLN